MCLSIDTGTLYEYSNKAENNTQSCTLVLRNWINSNGHDEYPVTWPGLRKLVTDMGQRTAAEKLQKVLDASLTL